MYGKYLLIAVFVSALAAVLGHKHGDGRKKFEACLDKSGLTKETLWEMKKSQKLMCGDESTEELSRCITETFGEFDGTDLSKETIMKHFRGYEEDIPKLEKCIDESQEKEAPLKPCSFMDCNMENKVRFWKKREDREKENKENSA